jgi:hypothetical protein
MLFINNTRKATNYPILVSLNKHPRRLSAIAKHGNGYHADVTTVTPSPYLAKYPWPSTSVSEGSSLQRAPLLFFKRHLESLQVRCGDPVSPFVHAVVKTFMVVYPSALSCHLFRCPYKTTMPTSRKSTRPCHQNQDAIPLNATQHLIANACMSRPPKFITGYGIR